LGPRDPPGLACNAVFSFHAGSLPEILLARETRMSEITIRLPKALRFGNPVFDLRSGLSGSLATMGRRASSRGSAFGSATSYTTSSRDR